MTLDGFSNRFLTVAAILKSTTEAGWWLVCNDWSVMFQWACIGFAPGDAFCVSGLWCSRHWLLEAASLTRTEFGYPIEAFFNFLKRSRRWTHSGRCWSQTLFSSENASFWNATVWQTKQTAQIDFFDWHFPPYSLSATIPPHQLYMYQWVFIVSCLYLVLLISSLTPPPAKPPKLE